MSVWTHVSGGMNLNVGGILSVMKKDDPVAMLESVVGSWENESFDCEYIKYPSSSLEYVKSYGTGPDMPLGSEGPMMFKAYRVGTDSSIHNGMLSFWGDLRDFDDKDVKEKIIPWFRSLLGRLKDSNISIRGMAIEIETEGHSNRWLLTYEYDSNYVPSLQVVKVKVSME